MSHAQYFDWLFKVATGWLGWSPDVALTTPMVQISLALEGRADYLRRVNGVPDKDDAADPVATGGPDALVAALRRRKNGNLGHG